MNVVKIPNNTKMSVLDLYRKEFCIDNKSYIERLTTSCIHFLKFTQMNQSQTRNVINSIMEVENQVKEYFNNLSEENITDTSESGITTLVKS